MHCDDEELLAYLDAELTSYQRKVIAHHLESCSDCRERLAGIKQEFHWLSIVTGKPFNFDSGWSVTSKLRLNEAMKEIDEQITNSIPKFLTGERTSNRLIWSIVGIAASLALFHILDHPPTRTLPTAAMQEVARASAVEKTFLSQPIQQTIAVEIDELRPAHTARSSRLDVWADQETGRFASKWTNNDGTLRHAVWRPGNGSEDFLYYPAIANKPIPRHLDHAKLLPLDSLSEYGLEASKIEAAFTKWLETAAGQPVSFISDLEAWAQQNGTIVKMETISTLKNKPLVRFTTRRTIRNMTMELRVDFDSVSYLPRLQAIRFETPEQAIEFRLIAKTMKHLVPSDMNSAMFKPESTQSTDLIPRSSMALLERKPEQIKPDFSLSNDADLIEGQIQAHYHLHQAGACLGNPVRIEQKEGEIEITNPENTWPTSNIVAKVPLEILLEAFASLRDNSLSFAIDEDNSAGIPAMALRHAWAINHIALHFPAEKTVALSANHLHLLEKMVQDHVGALGDQFLNSSLRQPPSAHTSRTIRGWREASTSLFEALLTAHEISNDEQIEKITPSLVDIQMELREIVLDIKSENQRIMKARSHQAHTVILKSRQSAQH